MVETFRFVRLDEGDMWKNAAWKWRNTSRDWAVIVTTGYDMIRIR